MRNDGVGRASVWLGITLIIAILIAWAIPPFVDRRDFVAAVNNYEKIPTLENEVALAREYDENRRTGLLIRLGVGSLVFVVLNVGWVLVTKKRIADAI